MLFFAVLVLAFFARQAGLAMNPRTHIYARDWAPLRLPVILYFNTGVLLLSSFSIERARQHIFREIDVLEEWLGLGQPALRRAIPWLAATLLLGILTLGWFKRVENRQIAVDVTAWYWHTMSLAWLLLFGVLVLGQ
jgi:cytochrome c oxidase subunit 3